MEEETEAEIKVVDNVETLGTFEEILDAIKARCDSAFFIKSDASEKPLFLVYCKEKNHNLQKLMRKIDDLINKPVDRLDILHIAEYDKIEVVPRSKRKEKVGRRKMEL